jgi:hypothetical protein
MIVRPSIMLRVVPHGADSESDSSRALLTLLGGTITKYYYRLGTGT